jgi:hypothetical protein
MPVRQHMASGTARSTHPGTRSAPTPYTFAVWRSTGAASRFPSTTPARHPAIAGTMAWLV